MRLTMLGSALWLLLVAPGAEVELRTFRFRDPVIEVAAGETVRWINRDAIAHTVTSGMPDRPDTLFDGRLERAGEGFAHRFDRAGTYPYFCARHRFMRGHVRVVPHSNGAR
jgi:plastocyanin